MDRREFIQAAAVGAAVAGAGVTDAEAQASAIPIIDTHVHIYDPTRPQGIPWPNKEQPASIYRRFLPGDYAKIAEPHGVVGAIETECSPWIEDNYWVMDVSKNEPIMVGEVGDLLLGHPDYREHLERLNRNPLYVGIRVSNLWGRNVEELLKKPQVWSDLKALSDAGLSMDFGGGPKEVRQLLQITDRIPGLRVAINHLPGARVPDDPAERATWQKNTQELAKRPHIYVKFSEIFQRVDERGRRVQTGGRIPKDLAFYKPRLDEIYETFGPDRLMFASDWTNSEPMSTFGELVALDRAYFGPKGREVMEKVFWKNSLAAYRWKKRRANQPSLA
ncbi:MAG: amidohydrolase family protein [Alphaproteobacteria bacterium]